MGILIFLAVALFAVIFFRLWSLQVLSGQQYLAQANNNRVRDIKIQAPRGNIVDRNGAVLVDNRTSLVVQLQPDKIPASPQAQQALYARLASVIHASPADITRAVNDQRVVQPFAAPIIKQDVDLQTASFLLEHQDQYPQVQVQEVFVRDYPQHQVGAQMFGTVGEVTKQELDQHSFTGNVGLGDRVGQSGIEYSYDQFLRGQNGATRVQVDSEGRVTGQLTAQAPVQGQNLKLSVDSNVQNVGQAALGGRQGAFVVMDTQNGQVVALGSTPSFDPNVFSKQVTQSAYKALTSSANGAPLENRAIQGLYPTGSSFKLITAVASLQGGLITPDTVVDDPGSITIGNITFSNNNGTANGPVALRRAIQVSSDVYFYRLGAQAFKAGDGHLLQQWAGRLGIGHKTGVDIGQEASGLVPSPEWRDRLFAQHKTDRPYSIGDNVNLAVGQGDLETNPLQMAVAYSAVANGGNIVTPHVGAETTDNAGKPIKQFDPPPQQHVDIAAGNRQAILDGLRQAASLPGGTSEPVFGNFPIPVGGKTGTAQVGSGQPQSWYMSLAPYPNPRYVVAVTIEHGGYGAEAAAPVARQIWSALFNVQGQQNVYVPGAHTPN